MTARKLEQTKAILLQRWKELDETLSDGLRHMAEDRQDLFEDGTEAGINEAEGRDIVLIQGALERLKQGCYGLCEECGSPISSARLNALPHAATCVGCQSKLENGRGRTATRDRALAASTHHRSFGASHETAGR